MKDPAVTWYFDNWDGGTKLLSRHQKGCYMDLLSAQFHCGPLTIENIQTVLGNDFAEWDKCLKAKFQEEDGVFFNERMEHEISKRRKEIKGKSDGGKKAMQKRWSGKDKILNNIDNKILNNIDNKSLNIEYEYDIDINNVIKSEEKKEKSKREKTNPTLIFPYTSVLFMQTWEVLIRQSKWKKKSQDALQTSLEQLSKYDEHTAVQMMKNTIAGGWQGLFEIKKYNNGNNEKSGFNGSSTLDKSIASSIEAMRSEGEGNSQPYGEWASY